jgi:hypothetical protein
MEAEALGQSALMSRLNAIIVFLVILILRPFHALAWNIPGHMLSGAIAYQILQRENPTTIARVRSILEKNSWYETRWKSQLGKLPEAERDEMIFTLAARWADDIRTRDKTESRLPWHYVDFPFKPEGEPASIQATEPPQENIVTAIAENTQILRTGSDPVRRGVALAWLFHLVGDVHQPLHAVQLFTREYPNGDRGGGDFCVRVTQDRAALSLHRLWHGLITSSNNVGQLRKIAAALLSRFSSSSFRELDHSEPESWAKESYEVATKIAYQNGSLRGTPKGQVRDCRDVTAVTYVFRGYPAAARLIADRRMYLAGYRLSRSFENG